MAKSLVTNLSKLLANSSNYRVIFNDQGLPTDLVMGGGGVGGWGA